MMRVLFLWLCVTALPPERIAQLLARSIGYDKNLKTRAGDNLVIAVIGGCGEMEKAFAALKGVRVQGVPIEVTSLVYDKSFAEKVKAIDVAYVCAGVTAIAEITAQTRKAKVLTIAGASADVKKGLTLGYELDGERVTLLVNKTAAKAEGVEFAEQILGVAKVID